LLSLDIQEKIILWILEAFEKKWICFAYPTQTIHTPDMLKNK
jgi:small-conductance mechanosensitive channel